MLTSEEGVTYTAQKAKHMAMSQLIKIYSRFVAQGQNPQVVGGSMASFVPISHHRKCN